MKTLAERLCWARERKELTQTQLAERAKVSQSTIGNLEAGIRFNARRITAIAAVLEVDPNWLAEGVGSPQGRPQEPVRAVEKAATDMINPDDLIELQVNYRNSTPRGRTALMKLSRTTAKASDARRKRVVGND
jgi:transcriptional regulator with XRE-family HTH domain